MAEHELKTHKEPWEAVHDGRKRYEVRVNDRGFKVGDTLRLREFLPCKNCNGSGQEFDGYMEHFPCCEKPHGTFTKRALRAKVTYMTEGGNFGLPDELCVLGLGRVVREAGRKRS